MKNSEIKALSITELSDKFVSEKATLDKLKFSHAISPLENPMQIREARKLVARLKTELNAKQTKA